MHNDLHGFCGIGIEVNGPWAGGHGGRWLVVGFGTMSLEQDGPRKSPNPATEEEMQCSIDCHDRRLESLAPLLCIVMTDSTYDRKTF